MLTRAIRHRLWRRRVRAAHAWRDAERERRDAGPRSILRELLAGTLSLEELEQMEIAPGQWLLPGPPP